MPFETGGLFVVVADSLAFNDADQRRIDDFMDAGYRFAGFKCEQQAKQWINAAIKNADARNYKNCA